MENKTEEWEAQAWEELRKADEKTLKNLKDNEALFDNMVYYTRPKNEVEELTAIVSIDSDTKIINILWTEADEELIEDYIESKIDEIPAGTFFIKFWGFDEKTSYEYDEWDFITSVNYEIEKYSDLNFEKTLKRYAEYEEELEKTQAQYNAVVNQNRELQEELRPFRHEYFKALDTNTIAELAKKSIKITTLNIELESKLDDADRQLQECIKSKCSDCESDIISVNKKICKSLTKSLDENNRYCRALEEIKEYQKRNCETCNAKNTKNCNANCQVFVILDIVNKAK